MEERVSEKEISITEATGKKFRNNTVSDEWGSTAILP
jgi:hypothetical protein